MNNQELLPHLFRTEYRKIVSTLCRRFGFDQIEIAETEAYKLGMEVPVRLSGDTKGTPIVTLRGPAGDIQTEGLIVAKRHIHMSTKDAEARGLKHGDQVEVTIDGKGVRDLIFRNVVIRVDPGFVTEMHIDTDEANAAHIEHGGLGELTSIDGCVAHITHCPTSTTDKSQQGCLNSMKKEAA